MNEENNNYNSYKSLIAAVLYQAVEDLILFNYGKNIDRRNDLGDKHKERYLLIKWFESISNNIFSFTWICGGLGINKYSFLHYPISKNMASVSVKRMKDGTTVQMLIDKLKCKYNIKTL